MSTGGTPPVEEREDPHKIATGMTLADISIRNHVFAWILMFALIGFGLLTFTGFGTVFKSLDEPKPDESLTIERLSEEHATVRVSNGHCKLAPGDLVRVLPNHACVVSNLVDCVWLVSGTEVVDQLEVAARGRIA